MSSAVRSAAIALPAVPTKSPEHHRAARRYLTRLLIDLPFMRRNFAPPPNKHVTMAPWIGQSRVFPVRCRLDRRRDHDGLPLSERPGHDGFCRITSPTSAPTEYLGPNGSMMTAPMLADFAVRLAFGLSIATLLIPWRTVPLPFFRTQAQIILGLLVLAALDQARASGTGIRVLDHRCRRGVWRTSRRSRGGWVCRRLGSGRPRFTADRGAGLVDACVRAVRGPDYWRSTPRAGWHRVFCWGRRSARCCWVTIT